MKNKLMAVVLATSLFATPAFADGEGAADAGWGIGSMVSAVWNAPASWHKSNPKITGTLALAVVAIIAYNLGKSDDNEETKAKDGELL